VIYYFYWESFSKNIIALGGNMKKPLHFVDLFFKQKNRKQSFVVSLIFCSLVFSIILGGLFA